jgi:hypothetical protein
LDSKEYPDFRNVINSPNPELGAEGPVSKRQRLEGNGLDTGASFEKAKVEEKNYTMMRLGERILSVLVQVEEKDPPLPEPRSCRCVVPGD